MAYIEFGYEEQRSILKLISVVHSRSEKDKAHRKATGDGYLVIVEVVGAEQRSILKLIE